MEYLAIWSGWLAVALFVCAASIPIGIRIREKRRAAPDSRPMRVHVVIGLTLAAVAAGHTLAALPSLGESATVGAGSYALVPGALAVLLVVAHAGLGFQLREPRLRGRPKKRRAHVITAIAISLAVGAHVLAFVLAS